MTALCFALTLLLTATAALAQDIRGMTEDGRPVLLRLDGTWAFDSSEARRAHDCAARITEEIGDDGTPKRAARSFIGLGNGGKGGRILLMYSMEMVIVALYVPDAESGCIDEGGTVYFAFTDESGESAVNREDFNCSGEATVYLGGELADGASLLTALQTRTLRGIVITTAGDERVVMTVTPDEARTIRETIGCLVR